MLAAKLGSVKSHPGSAGFTGKKGSWREAEAWHCLLQAARRGLSEGQPQWQLKAQD